MKIFSWTFFFQISGYQLRFYHFCDSRNNIETGRSLFQPNLFVKRVPTEKDSEILFGGEHKRENYIYIRTPNSLR